DAALHHDDSGQVAANVYWPHDRGVRSDGVSRGRRGAHAVRGRLACGGSLSCCLDSCNAKGPRRMTSRAFCMLRNPCEITSPLVNRLTSPKRKRGTKGVPRLRFGLVWESGSCFAGIPYWFPLSHQGS